MIDHMNSPKDTDSSKKANNIRLLHPVGNVCRQAHEEKRQTHDRLSLLRYSIIRYHSRHGHKSYSASPPLLFVILLHTCKYHLITVISIVQGTVYTADRSCGSSCLLGNIKVCTLIGKHLGYLEALR